MAQFKLSLLVLYRNFLLLLLLLLRRYQSLSLNYIKSSGLTDDFWWAGITTFGGIVIISNLKIVIFSNNFTFLTLFLIFGSILTYILAFIIV